MNTKATLRPEDLEYSILVNCMINPNADKRLTLYRIAGPVRNTGITRNIFIYLADKAGIDPQLARDYIGMTKEEYDGRFKQIPEMYEHGKVLFEDRPQYYDEVPLYFYRKLKLILNYIHRYYGVNLHN